MNHARKRPLIGRHLLLATDRADKSRDLVDILQILGKVDCIAIGELPPEPPANVSGVVVDIDLQAAKTVTSFGGNLFGEPYRSIPRLFVVSGRLHHGTMQAWALGATDTIARPFDARGILQRILAAFPDSVDADATGAGEALNRGVEAAHLVMVKIFERIPTGVPLVLDDLLRAERKIMRAIKRTSLNEWLTAVGRHHNHSYRHCLFVTGFAVAFAQHLGMREADQRRVTRAALIHDVGKAFVPKAILEKSGRLNAAEVRELRLHPRHGYDAMVAQGGFPREMLDVVLHHHELLDGSGFPDGLSGNQISDIVRMISIVDNYAELIGKTAAGSLFNYARAFDRMERMGGKLDQDLLAAFRPVVLGA